MVVVVLWTLAVVATIWVLAPSVAFALRIGGVRTEVLREVGPPSISGDQTVFDERLSQLAALGFRNVGRTRQTALFMLPAHWRWSQFETTEWLVGPDGRTHATLYRQIRDEPARISFVTVFDDGGVVRTMCPGTGGHFPSLPNYRATELRGLDASALLAAHEEQVATYARERNVNPRAATVADAAATSDAAERPLLRQIGAGTHGWVLPFAPAILFVVGGYMTGNLGSPVVPLGICVAASAYAFKRWMVIGPLRHIATRSSHVGDPVRDLAIDGPPLAGPAPAGLAEVGPDGTTEAMRKDRWVLRAVATGSALLVLPGMVLFAKHPRSPIAAGLALIGLQLFWMFVTASAGLLLLNRARGDASQPAAKKSGGYWVLPLVPLGFVTVVDGPQALLRHSPVYLVLPVLIAIGLFFTEVFAKKKDK